MLRNDGQLRHELALGEPEALRRHAAMMQVVPIAIRFVVCRTYRCANEADAAIVIRSVEDDTNTGNAYAWLSGS